MHTQTLTRFWHGLISIGSVAIGMAVLGYWAGLPRHLSPSVFLGGLLFFIVLSVLFLGAGWFALLRPIATPIPQRTAPTWQPLLGVLLAIANINLVIGGFWDEVWHRSFGLPFGKDLFWAPHWLIYTGFLAALLVGGWAFGWLARQPAASWSVRTRQYPLLTLLILQAAFLLYALPADPIWHNIYGSDLSAWSLPHLILLASIVSIGLLGIAFWGVAARVVRHNWLATFILAALLLQCLQIFVTDWESIQHQSTASSQLLSRPIWFLPFLLSLAAHWVGSLAQKLTNPPGALKTGLLALLVRAALILVFRAQMQGIRPLVACLPILFALDISAWAAARWAKNPRQVLLYRLLGSAFGVLGLLWVMSALYSYPLILPTNAGLFWGTSLFAALWGMASGSYIGDLLRVHCPALIVDQVPQRWRWLPAGAFALMFAIVLGMILTAIPPTG